MPVLASLRLLRNIVDHSRPFWNSVERIGFPLTISGKSLAHPSAIALLRSFDQQRKTFFGAPLSRLGRCRVAALASRALAEGSLGVR